MEQIRLFVLRSFFSVGGRVFPGFTLDRFWNLLFTIRKKPVKSYRKEIIGKARSSVFFINDPLREGKESGVRTYHWKNPGKTVLLLHGWEGAASDFFNFIPALIENGYNVYAFDAPGHGKSEGSKSSLPHMLLSLKAFVAKYGHPDFLIGHSMGGTAAAIHLAESVMPASKLVMLGTPLKPKQFFRDVSRHLNVPAKVESLLYKRIEKLFSRPVADFDLFRFSGRINAVNALFIVDQKDHLVEKRQALKFVGQNPGFTIRVTKGLGHYKIVRDSGVLQIILAFLSEGKRTTKARTITETIST